MSNLYTDLIYHKKLYPTTFINDFGVSGKHWANESDRKRERSLCHDMVCVYLCNMEELSYDDALMQLEHSVGRKRKRSEAPDSPSKKLKSKETNIGESTQSISTIAATSSSSHSSGTNIEIVREVSESAFRFVLIEGMPNPDQIQNHYTDLWGIRKMDSLWDIIDVKLKKFIELKVSRDRKMSIRKYEDKAINHIANSALCIVSPETGIAEWFDHPGNVQGEAKVLQFILTRKGIMTDLGILETGIQDTENLTDYIFCDKVFNELRDAWVNDWWPKETKIEITDELQEGNKAPQNVTAKELLKHLSKLDEKERIESVKWSGKIIPEGWCHNLETENATDSTMVSCFMSFIEEQDFVYEPNKEKDSDKEWLLKELVDWWRESDGNNFYLKQLRTRVVEEMKLRLGIGMKTRVHAEDDSTKQPEYSTPSLLKYDFYYDEIIRRMRKEHGFTKYPFMTLKEDLIDSEHPIADMSSRVFKNMIDQLSKTNAAIFSSKLTNIYSRLGGSYLINKKTGGTTHDDLAVFPIYATLRDPELQEKSRIISGIMFRGPHHARSPTDRIPIVTVEIMPMDDNTIYFLEKQNKHDVWYNQKYVVVVRSNSVMKEDSAFVTFNSNSIFVPANLLGVMTIENPNVAPNIDMKVFINDFYEQNKDWFTERFVEGVLVSAVMNSRDEGYFAQLRKLYMVLLCFRRHKVAANWDIKKFCNKVNDCLVDNPISMHFHNTLLKIIQHYSVSTV